MGSRSRGYPCSPPSGRATGWSALPASTSSRATRRVPASTSSTSRRRKSAVSSTFPPGGRRVGRAGGVARRADASLPAERRERRGHHADRELPLIVRSRVERRLFPGRLPPNAGVGRRAGQYIVLPARPQAIEPPEGYREGGWRPRARPSIRGGVRRRDRRLVESAGLARRDASDVQPILVASGESLEHHQVLRRAGPEIYSRRNLEP